MYTLVLMATLSAAPDAAAFGGGLRDRLFGGGCSGTTANAACYGTCSGAGSCYGSCTGSSYACYGSCTGCCGGGGFGSRLRAFFHRNDSSCYGSCTGRSYACYGSCSGFSCGGFAPIPGGSIPTGGEFAPPAPTTSFVAPPSGGCATCGVPLGTPTPVGAAYSPMAPIPPVPTVSQPAPRVEESRSPTRALATAGSNRATVVVRLPADAKLYAEGRPLALESAERSFVTPVLPAGREFEYTFRAEYVRDGETISQTKKVTVRAGGTMAVEFTDLTAKRPVTETKSESPKADLTSRPATPGNPFLGGTTVPTGPAVPQMPVGQPVSAERARITVKVPAGVTLYVDDKRNDRTEPTREFTTPPLPAGQEFAYTMKAERVRNGQPESQTQKITFRAGEIVTVDFSSWPR